MMIGVAETLLACGRIDPDLLMAAFVTNFDADRAYGPGTHQIIDMASACGDWRALAETIFPGGSLGNGAAMRVAPVGLLFHHDLDRLSEQAVLSAMPTHTHPVGVDGARLLAIAIAFAIREPEFDPARFFAELQRQAATEEFADALARAAGLISTGNAGLLGTSLEAHRSVPTALACFASYPDSYADAVGRAIGLGGDTDTHAAMIGALCGARLGAQAIPTHLLAMLEDGPKGRGYIDDLAHRLHAAWEQRKADHEETVP